MLKWSFIAAFGFLLACEHRASTPVDTLVAGIDSAPTTLDPRFATDANGMRISNLIFDSLVRLGRNLEVVPDAAERWTYKDHVYTFFLRRDLHFHNGRPLTVEDVEFSFQHFLSPSSPFASVLDIIRDVHVTEDARRQIQVRIAVKAFSDKFLKADLPSIKLLPKTEIVTAEERFKSELIGTGPYRLVRQNQNEIWLERQDEKAAASRFLEFKIIRDDYTRYQKTLKGELDIVQMEISPDRVADFQKRPRDFQVFLYPGLSTTYLLINFRDPHLKQKAVREILAHSVNREELIHYKLHDLAQAATSILTPITAYHAQGLKNLPFDLEAARQLVRGLNLKGITLTLKTSNTPQAIDTGKVLAYQISQSGLKTELLSYEWSTFYNDIKHGNFQLATMRWVGVIDPDIYRLAFHSSEKPPGRNRGSYQNPELDQLLTDGTKEENVVQRKHIFDRVQRLVLEDLAIIPLWYDQQIAVVKATVRGYQPSAFGDFWPFVEAHKSAD